MFQIKKYLSFLVEPFTKNLHHLVSIFVLISTYDLMYFYFDKGYREHVLCLASHLVLLSYLAVAFYSLLPSRLKRIYLFVLYLVCGFHFVLGTFSYIVMHINPRADFIFAIMGTNPQEASEFVSIFFNAKVLIIAIGLPILLFIISKWIKKHPNGKKIKISIGIPLIVICTVFFLHKPSVWVNGIMNVYYNVIFNFERCPDLTKYATSPQLVFQDSHPKNIVIIIGESETKTHSSLYNYEYPTNPRLEALRDDSLLFVFSDVISPGTTTLKVFRYLLNTFHPEEEGEKNWYESTTIFDVTRLCGYSSAWLSNQSKHGLWDNLVGKFSELCDTSVFVGNMYAGGERYWCDGELIPITKGVISSKHNDQSLSLTIIHLLGSHEDFFLRYPSDFSIFKKEDYLQYPENQRNNRASYDNSILYNDYVVSELIKLFSDKESIVFYFSDHGMDIYETNDNFIGHGFDDICLRIPFFVYTSPSFKHNYPLLVERIKDSQNKPFRTDDLIYSVMDVAGISFENNDDVAQRSLFRSSIKTTTE